MTPIKRSFCFFVFLCGCASKPTFKPEVGGEGSVSSRGGVVYSIPQTKPVLKMRLGSMMIPKDNIVQVRMFFLRKGPPAGEYLDPREQSLTLPDSPAPIFPDKVHASVNAKPIVKLADQQKQAVELIFTVPAGGNHQYPYINLNWKVHYHQNGEDKTEAQTERFDYVSKIDTEGASPYQEDSEFPYVDYYGPMPAEWEMPGWMWW